MVDVPIQDIPPRVSLTAIAAQTAFSFPFVIFAEADLVAERNRSGVITTLVDGVDYNVDAGSIAPDIGGGITLTAGATVGDMIVMTRQTTIQRLTDFARRGKFDADTVNLEFDTLTAILQELALDLDRKSGLSSVDSGSLADLSWPLLDARKNTFAAWDALGGLTTAVGTSANLGPVSAFIDTLLPAVDAAAGRLTLDAQQDLDVPSQAEAEAGTATNERVWTAQRVQQAIAAQETLPRSYLAGLELSNNSAQPLDDLDIAVGEARDSTNASDMVLASALVKQIDAAWAVGTNAGGLDGTESVPGVPDINTWYHVWLIKRTDTGVVDVLFSENATTPTFPTGYDRKRRLGAVLTDGAANIIPFTQLGDEFLWDVPVSDYSATNPGTAAILRVLKVPTGLKMWAIHTSAINDGGTLNVAVLVTDPDQPDTAPSLTIFTYRIRSIATAIHNATRDAFRVNTLGQIRVRLNVSGGTTLSDGITHGWYDRRGRDD